MKRYLLDLTEFPNGIRGFLNFVERRFNEFQSLVVDDANDNKLKAAILDAKCVSNDTLKEVEGGNRIFRIQNSESGKKFWAYCKSGATANDIIADAAKFLEVCYQMERRRLHRMEAELYQRTLPITYQTSTILDLMTEHWFRGRDYIDSNIRHCMETKPASLNGFLQWTFVNDGAKDKREIERRQAEVARKKRAEAAEDLQRKAEVSDKHRRLMEMSNYAELRERALVEIDKRKIPAYYRTDFTINCFVECIMCGNLPPIEAAKEMIM